MDVSLVEAVNNAAANFKPDVSEFNEVYLTPKTCKVIDGVAVKEAPISMECKLDQIIKVGKGFMLLGEVLHFYIDDNVYLGDFKIDFQKLNPLARLAGNQYGELGNYFSMERTFDPNKVVESIKRKK
ncbi:flavin reductase family protein [Bacillus dakarensis]|uniref:flavin reductase family protein n=1 Tax=Robertmurraya dakarensis TaxID=1926278 RepID=UPI000A06FAFE|nr:flavin reductase family protein [Bacillus dakarensis]